MRLGLRQATLKLGDQWILDAADLQLHERERIGLIGLNGAGKTTLLKVLMGSIQLDSGERIVSSGVTMGGVVQTPQHNPASTIAQEVALGLGATGKAWIRWQRALETLDDHEMAEAQYEMDQYQAWDVEARVAAQLDIWRLPQDAYIEGLSGGELKRVSLAQAWIAQPEILFLDEPTNHLDLLGIRQLELAVKNYLGIVICISHDRTFLDTIVTRILELDRGHLTGYPGNYATYVILKEKALEEEAIHSAKSDKFLAQEEVWIRKGVEARRTRNEGRVRRLERLREERQQRRDPRAMADDWKLVSGDRSGHQIVVMDNVSYILPEGRPLIRDFTTRFLRGDRIGIVGPNGVGKSTLLKLILGGLEPTEGAVERGTRLTVAYFDQMREQLDGQQTVLDMISPGSEWLEWNGERIHRMGYLLQFGFTPRQVNQPVRSLSGGERQRLLLARLFSQPANLLVLDEPTNDLDMETLDILEATLQRYTGTVFLVTHDRQFLDNVVTQMVVFEPNGVLKEYPGGYSDWTFWDKWFKQWDDYKLANSTQHRSTSNQSVTESSISNTLSVEKRESQSSILSSPPSESGPALSKKERQELEQLPAKIELFEQQLQTLHNQLGDPKLYSQPLETQQKLTDELNTKVIELEQQRDKAYQRWEALDARS